MEGVLKVFLVLESPLFRVFIRANVRGFACHLVDAKILPQKAFKKLVELPITLPLPSCPLENLSSPSWPQRKLVFPFLPPPPCHCVFQEVGLIPPHCTAPPYCRLAPHGLGGTSDVCVFLELRPAPLAGRKNLDTFRAFGPKGGGYFGPKGVTRPVVGSRAGSGVPKPTPKTSPAEGGMDSNTPPLPSLSTSWLCLAKDGGCAACNFLNFAFKRNQGVFGFEPGSCHSVARGWGGLEWESVQTQG